MSPADDVRIDFTTDNGQICIKVPPEFLRGVHYLKTMSLTINGETIVRMPFHLHGLEEGEPGPLHTICSRVTGEVQQVQW